MIGFACITSLLSAATEIAWERAEKAERLKQVVVQRHKKLIASHQIDNDLFVDCPPKLVTMLYLRRLFAR